VKELEREVAELARLVEEGERQAFAEQQKWEAEAALWWQQEIERRIAHALQESKKALLQIIDDWAGTAQIDQFFTDMERRATMLESRQLALDRLERARQLLAAGGYVEMLKRWGMSDDQ
jgi:hypothetical protein